MSRRLSKDEIFREEDNAMATIHPPANGVSFNREEAAANTWNGPKRTELTADQFIARDNALRAKAPQNPDSHNARAAIDAADRQARQKAHDDKQRAALAAAEAAKGSRLTLVESREVLAGKPLESIRRQYNQDGTWNEVRS
jgi:hypothetical protein